MSSERVWNWGLDLHLVDGVRQVSSKECAAVIVGLRPRFLGTPVYAPLATAAAATAASHGGAVLGAGGRPDISRARRGQVCLERPTKDVGSSLCWPKERAILRAHQSQKNCTT